MKLIGSDYDGTLNYGGFDNEKRAALARWHAAGHAFAVVSGRPMESLLEMWKRDALTYEYIVAFNGAIVGRADGTVFNETRCDGALARPLIATMLANGCPWCDLHADKSYRVFAAPHDVLEEGEIVADALPPIPYFYQICTMLSDFDTAAAVTAVLQNTFGKQLNPLQNGICIDVVHRSVNKAEGLRRLARQLNVAPSDIIAVGDNINDTDMIAAFRSYAMENGVECIKQLATHITPSVTRLIERELER